MSAVGYNPGIFMNMRSDNVSETSVDSISHHSTQYIALKCLSYVGPILMGIGFFVLMVAVVLHCEIKDKFFGIITPMHNVKDFTKTELYHMVIREFRRNYFRGVEVPLRKPPPPEKTATEKSTLFQALSISTPALLLTPDIPCKWLNVREKQQTSNSKRKLKRKFRSQDSWLKTSSLPNIGHKNQSESNIEVSKHEKHKDNKKEMSRSCEPTIDSSHVPCSPQMEVESAFDNPAFRDSPTQPLELESGAMKPFITSGFTNRRSLSVHEAAVHNSSQMAKSPFSVNCEKDARESQLPNGSVYKSHDVLEMPGNNQESDTQNTFQRIIVKIRSCGNLKSELFRSKSPVFFSEDECKETTPLNQIDHRTYTKPFQSESLLFVPGTTRRKSYGDGRSWNALSLTKDNDLLCKT